MSSNYQLKSEIEKVPSNLSSVFEAFLASPFRVAPERAEELLKITSRYQIMIRVNNACPDWRFEELGFSGMQIILANNRTIERLWCYCYAYVCIITELQQAGIHGFHSVRNKPAFNNAFRLFKWAAQKTEEEIHAPWPEDLPTPCDLEEHIPAANHIFLMASGRIILHEIGHEVTREQTFTKMESEYRADAWADSWMLDEYSRYSSDPKVFIGRALGIAFSHVPALYFGDHQIVSESHPTSGQRVINFVRKWYPNANPLDRDPFHLPCANLLMVMLHLLFIRGAIWEDQTIPNNYVELFESLGSHFN